MIFPYSNEAPSRSSKYSFGRSAFRRTGSNKLAEDVMTLRGATGNVGTALEVHYKNRILGETKDHVSPTMTFNGSTDLRISPTSGLHALAGMVDFGRFRRADTDDAIANILDGVDDPKPHMDLLAKGIWGMARGAPALFPPPTGTHMVRPVRKGSPRSAHHCSASRPDPG